VHTVFAFENLLASRHSIADTPDRTTLVARNSIISKHLWFGFILQVLDAKGEFYNVDMVASFNLSVLKIWTGADHVLAQYPHLIEFTGASLRGHHKRAHLA
jgi:hypothetical protein